MKARTRRPASPTRRLSVVVVGSGFAGLAAAIALKKVGVEDLTVLERASEVGGTWQANRYPGVAVDTSILNYSLSFDPNPGWSRLYADGAELLSYVKGIAERHDVRRHIRFDTAVTEATYDVGSNTWQVMLGDGSVLSADVLIPATGILSTPKVPHIPGLETFKGTVLHSAEWDSSFDASGRSIAQIGSGATAAQLVPELAKSANALYVYQRSAPWVFPRNDREIGRVEGAIYRRLPFVLKLKRWRQFWLNDIVQYGFEKQNRTLDSQTRMAAAFLDRSVSDPDLRRALVPDYEIGCKRRVTSDDWYPTLQRENVTLIPSALTSVGEDSVVGVDGIARKVDTLVFSTGFSISEMVPMKVFGNSGQELHSVWSQGAKTHLGISTAGFPNLFFVGGPNTGAGSGAAPFMLEAQARYVAQAVDYLARTDAVSLDLIDVVQERSYRQLQLRLAGAVYGSGCVGWYQNANGTIDTIWPGTAAEYWLRTRRFRPHDFHIVRAQESSSGNRSGATTRRSRPRRATR
ncbi:flavin-containing monooxygenase [Rhodococcus wratislaviensis]|uniref:flavin-containing monooxygenase n=1 Tax=Rhodococcus wratislaviensis TaxID=44752 RepID=UPI00364BF875